MNEKFGDNVRWMCRVCVVKLLPIIGNRHCHLSFHKKTSCFQLVGKGHLVDRFKQTRTKILMELDCAVHNQSTDIILIHLRVFVPP